MKKILDKLYLLIFTAALLVTVSNTVQAKMTNPSSNPMPLIVDDDGSQDGMTALVFMLQNPKFEVKAITISQGIAHPKIFGNNVMKMLTRLGKITIPVGVGSEFPLAGNNAFPAQFREESDTFWSPFVPLPKTALESVDSRDAAELIIDTIKQSPTPVTILATGPLTNIAEALRRDSTIVNNIASIHIMGGAVFVPGNLREHHDPIIKQNQVAEFNIWVDPVAAQEVFTAASAGLKIVLTTLDTTNKITFTRQDQQAWKATGTQEGIIAAEFLDFALSIISGNDPLIPNPVWDLVAAINLSEPSFCEEVPLHIKVDTTGKPQTTQCQTVVINNQPANAYVCLNPSFDLLPFNSEEIFGFSR